MTSFLRLMLPACLLLMLVACSPKYDWREVHASHAPYVAAFPAKPSNQTRDTKLAGKSVAMTMTSTQVDGVTFAVASAAMADASEAQAALPLWKAALLANLKGKIKLESSPRVSQGQALQIEVAASQGAPGKEQPLVVHARFIAVKQHLYQLVVMGPPQRVTRDGIDTFFTSFKTE
jgi:hypothetical protein